MPLPNLLGPWTGGVDYSKPAEELPPSVLFSSRNVLHGRGGEAFQRDGFERHISNTTNIGANTLNAAGKMRFSASSSVVFAIAGTKFFEDVSGTWTDRTNGETIGGNDDEVWEWINCNGEFIAVNGNFGDALIRWTASGNLHSGGLDVNGRFTWGTHCEWWDGRVWIGNVSTGVDQTFFSSNTTTETWGANDWFSIGEDVTGVARLGNAALGLHGENGITMIQPTGNASNPYRRDGRSARGTVSGRSIVEISAPGGGNVQVFVRQDGIYGWGGGEAEKISHSLDGDRFWNLIDRTRLQYSHATAHGQRDEVWFFLPLSDSIGGSQTLMNCIMIYDYSRNIWMGPYRSDDTTADWDCSATIDNVPHAGGNGDGYLLKLDDTNRQNDESGTAINCEMVTAAPPPEGTDVMNRWLWARHSYDVLGDYDVVTAHFAQAIPSESTTIGQGGGYDAIETSFEIESSKIAGEQLMASADTKLNGYDSSIQMSYANGNASEELSMRRVAAVYDPTGRMMKRGPGVI